MGAHRPPTTGTVVSQNIDFRDFGENWRFLFILYLYFTDFTDFFGFFITFDGKCCFFYGFSLLPVKRVSLVSKSQHSVSNVCKIIVNHSIWYPMYAKSLFGIKCMQNHCNSHHLLSNVCKIIVIHSIWYQMYAKSL